MRPGFLRLWEDISIHQRQTIKWYVQDKLKQDWGKVCSHLADLRHQRTSKRLMTRYAPPGKDFVLAVNEKLSDSADLVVILPIEGLSKDVLLYRSLGLKPIEVAELIGIDEYHVKKIATKEALMAFHNSDIEGYALKVLRKRSLSQLVLALAGGQVSVKELIGITRLVMEMEMHEQKRGKKAIPIDMIARTARKLEARHQQYMEEHSEEKENGKSL